MVKRVAYTEPHVQRGVFFIQEKASRTRMSEGALYFTTTNELILLISHFQKNYDNTTDCNCSQYQSIYQMLISKKAIEVKIKMILKIGCICKNDNIAAEILIYAEKYF